MLGSSELSALFVKMAAIRDRISATIADPKNENAVIIPGVINFRVIFIV
jgi:hypothetical protein